MPQHSPIAIGSRLELMVDDYLVDSATGGVQLALHPPTPREVALVTDQPWEGNSCGYVTVFQDDGLYRMYYFGNHHALSADQDRGEKVMDSHPMVICSAESSDGVHWERPNVGQFEFAGSRANNIVWWGVGEKQKGVHGFAPFRDAHPACAPDARYKAVGAERRATKGEGLYAMASPDGLRWSLMQDGPIITEAKFDSQNLAFWDAARGEYRCYMRDFKDGLRNIKTATSRDFMHWTQPEWLEFPGAPTEQLYTNQVTPYYRAPHIFLGFPSRYVQREWTPAIEALPELADRRRRSEVNLRYGTALTDGLFMSSRDGRTFKRWGEAFIRPGLRPVGNWAYGDNYQCWGLVETGSDIAGAPRELSLYATEGRWRGNSMAFRRYTLRIDGFVSMHAARGGGEFVTKPVTFEGAQLVLNMSTSAAGSIKVEVQDAHGSATEGHALDDCDEVIGDDLERVVTWAGSSAVARLAGEPIRLRFVMDDADLYSLRFR